MTTTTIIDQAGKVGSNSSLALGSDGRQHITYVDETNHRLKYATCANTCGSAGNWTKGTISQPSSATETSLKVNDAGRKHVSYSQLGEIWYATCAPTATCMTASQWTKARIDDGFGSALALAKSGAKEVSYLSFNGPFTELNHAVCMSACGEPGHWTRVMVDRMGGGFAWALGEVTSLAVGPDGRHHITYFALEKNDLKYATCLASCTNALNWQKLTIDQTGDVGGHSSLVLGQDGVLHVSYYDYTKQDLRYARCAFDCTTAASWKKLAVATANSVGRFTSLALESNGRVHIGSYHNTGTALYYSTCNADCTVSGHWNHATLDGANSDVGEYGSLAAKNGVVYVSYYDQANGDLRWLRRSPFVLR